MQFSSKLFFATLSALLAARTAISAPVSDLNFGVVARADADALTPEMEMAEDLTISDIKNALNTVGGVVQKIATVAKPIVDTISKVALVTPFAPEAALIDTAVNAATKIPVSRAPAAAAPASASAAAKPPVKVATKA